MEEDLPDFGFGEGEGGEGVKEVAEDEAEKEGVQTEHVEGEKVEGEHIESEQVEKERVEGEHPEGEHVEGEHVEGEHVEGEHVEGEHVAGEHAEGEHVEDEHVEGEHVEGEQVEGEKVKGEHVEGEQEAGEHVAGEGEELMGEELEGEFQSEVIEEKPVEEEPKPEEVEEEEKYVEEPPPDPAAPFDFSDSQEALKPAYQLRPDQEAEVEQLWEYFQNYTPAYTDLDGYITEKELIYMLKALMLMTYTPEQLDELITFCVRPPHPKGHINYEQFLKMVKMRQREFAIEEELRCALQVFDVGKTNEVNRDELKEVLAKQGHKMPQKQLDNLIKEVDMSNDGTIGIEDVVGTMCIDLNPEDIIMLRNAVFPPADGGPKEEDEDFF